MGEEPFTLSWEEIVTVFEVLEILPVHLYGVAEHALYKRLSEAIQPRKEASVV